MLCLYFLNNYLYFKINFKLSYFIYTKHLISCFNYIIMFILIIIKIHLVNIIYFDKFKVENYFNFTNISHAKNLEFIFNLLFNYLFS